MDLLSYAYNNLKHRKLRSYLTVLGIIIGIASIVVLISIGQGLDESIRAQLSRFGSNYMVIIPGALGGSSGLSTSLKGALYIRDSDALRNIEGVQDVSAAIGITGADVVFKGEAITGSVRGVQEGYGNYISTRANYSSGKFFDEGDTGSVVIGHTVATDYFDKEVRVGEAMSINGRKFNVVGIIEKSGQGVDFDTAIFVDLKAAQELKGEGYDKNQVTAIFLLVNEDADVRQVAELVEQKLIDRNHGTAEKKEFTIITATSVLDQISMITGLLSMFLGGIAAISLLVGAIGIANTMVTSVMERTREIGILKAIGACDTAVLELFLIESSLIGLTGGVAGAVIGLAASFILNALGAPSKVTPELLLFSVFFAVVIGGVSGFFPARSAAKLTPLQALRYE